MKALRLMFTAILLSASLTLAQQQSPSSGQQMQGMQMNNGSQGSRSMSKNQMMQSCQKNMDSMMKSNAQTTKDIEAAKQSNDPVKMRASLDEAEKALSPMNEHMKNCMDMMKMMQNMRGMTQHQGDSGQPK